MDIKFKNGSYIKIIPSQENYRSRRARIHFEKKYYPVGLFEEMTGLKFKWYEKLYLRYVYRPFDWVDKLRSVCSSKYQRMLFRSIVKKDDENDANR